MGIVNLTMTEPLQRACQVAKCLVCGGYSAQCLWRDCCKSQRLSGNCCLRNSSDNAKGPTQGLDQHGGFIRLRLCSIAQRLNHHPQRRALAAPVWVIEVIAIEGLCTGD